MKNALTFIAILVVTVSLSVLFFHVERWINWKLSYGPKVEERIQSLEQRIQKLEQTRP